MWGSVSCGGATLWSISLCRNVWGSHTVQTSSFPLNKSCLCSSGILLMLAGRSPMRKTRQHRQTRSFCALTFHNQQQATTKKAFSDVCGIQNKLITFYQKWNQAASHFLAVSPSSLVFILQLSTHTFVASSFRRSQRCFTGAMASSNCLSVHLCVLTAACLDLHHCWLPSLYSQVFTEEVKLRKKQHLWVCKPIINVQRLTVVWEIVELLN